MRNYTVHLNPRCPICNDTLEPHEPLYWHLVWLHGWKEIGTVFTGSTDTVFKDSTKEGT